MSFFEGLQEHYTYGHMYIMLVWLVYSVAAAMYNAKCIDTIGFWGEYRMRKYGVTKAPEGTTQATFTQKALNDYSAASQSWHAWQAFQWIFLTFTMVVFWPYVAKITGAVNEEWASITCVISVLFYCFIVKQVFYSGLLSVFRGRSWFYVASADPQSAFNYKFLHPLAKRIAGSKWNETYPFNQAWKRFEVVSMNIFYYILVFLGVIVNIALFAFGI
jgi:hypothetical protein